MILNPVVYQTGGGGGALKIQVNVETGSTVTASKDGSTYNGVEVSTGVYEIDVPAYGTYTVAATKGGQTASDTITLTEDSIALWYYPQLINYTMLYDAGDECTAVTGGWSADGWTWSGFPVSAGTKNANNMYLASGANTSEFLGPVNQISFTANSSLFERSKRTDSGGTNRFYLRAVSQKIFASGLVVYADVQNTSINVTQIVGGTIGNSATSAYIASFAYSQGAGYVYNVWVAAPDDWSTLCSIAGVTPPADLATLLADGTSLATILANQQAVFYMIRQCTGDFMSYAVASSTFLSAYAASPYKSMIDANTHWAKFLAMAA